MICNVAMEINVHLAKGKSVIQDLFTDASF